MANDIENAVTAKQALDCLLQENGISMAALDILQIQTEKKKKGKDYAKSFESIESLCAASGISSEEAAIVFLLLETNLFQPTIVGSSKDSGLRQLLSVWRNEYWEIQQNEMKPEELIFQGEAITLNGFWLLLAEAYKIDIGISDLERVLAERAEKYNPVSRWFEQLPKAKEGLIDTYANKVKTNTPKFTMHLKKHLVRCVKQLFEGGLQNKHCLTLIGGQNTGKTSYFLHLFGLDIFKHYTKPNGVEIGHKDSRIDLTRNFAIILDEADKYLNKKDSADIKALLGSGDVSERLQYEKNNTYKARIASFFATANAPILNDETGNVRFICFEVEKIDFSYRQVDIEALWAEAYKLYQEGFDCTLSKEEFQEMEAHSDFAEVESFELSLLRQYYEPCSEDEGSFESTANIVVFLENFSKNINKIAMGKALTKMFGQKRRARKNGKLVYGYYVKPST